MEETEETETRPQPGNGVLKAVQVSRMVSLRPERVLFYLHWMEGERERMRTRNTQKQE